MKIRKPLRFILLGACLIQSLAMAIDKQPTNTDADKLPNTEISVASKDDLSAQKELFQLQLDANKELLQKDIEAQSNRIDAFEKRIDDQTNRIGDIGSSVDMFGLVISLLSILIAALLVGLGFLGYKTAKSDARETAKEAAEKAASKWFEDNQVALAAQIKELESKATQAGEAIDDHQDKVAKKSSATQAKMDALEAAAQNQMQIIQNQMSQERTERKSENQLPQDNSAIEQKAEQLKQKPESEYTFADWNTRAFAAYSEGKLEDAIFYWDKVIGSTDIQQQTLVKSMFNKGLALGRLNRNEEAIVAYDAIIAQFGAADELNLRKQVAMALVNKGFALDQLNCYEEEIATYDAVIAQFGAAKELNLLEPVATAMVNKGITLRQLNRTEDAIAVYDAMITRFGAAEELSLRKQVAKAWNGKGFSLLCMAKANWANVTLAKELLLNANNACTFAVSKNSDIGVIHGNLAYITWLQGDVAAAEQHFIAGLASTVSGGEHLYKSTLTDFDIHPIEPDKGFRELVEKLWEEYKRNKVEN